MKPIVDQEQRMHLWRAALHELLVQLVMMRDMLTHRTACILIATISHFLSGFGLKMNAIHGHAYQFTIAIVNIHVYSRHTHQEKQQHYDG